MFFLLNAIINNADDRVIDAITSSNAWERLYSEVTNTAITGKEIIDGGATKEN